MGYQETSKKERKVIQAFVSQCKVININQEIKNKVIELRTNYKIKLPDAIIMASAIYLDLPLITSDSGFKKVEEELSLIYYEL